MGLLRGGVRAAGGEGGGGGGEEKEEPHYPVWCPMGGPDHGAEAASVEELPRLPEYFQHERASALKSRWIPLLDLGLKS